MTSTLSKVLQYLGFFFLKTWFQYSKQFLLFWAKQTKRSFKSIVSIWLGSFGKISKKKHFIEVWSWGSVSEFINIHGVTQKISFNTIL